MLLLNLMLPFKVISGSPTTNRCCTPKWKNGNTARGTTVLRFGPLMWRMCSTNYALTDERMFPQTLSSSFPQRPFWSGALAYDLVQWTQPLRLQHPPGEGTILAVLWLVDGGMVVDHQEETTGVFGHNETWCASAEAATPWDGSAVDVPAPQPHREAVTHTDETHESNVESVRQGIVNGQVYQVNIGKHWQGEIDHPYNVFQRLMRSNPAPFSSYTESEDLGFALASSSTESLLMCDGKTLQTSPIKGTCPQGPIRRKPPACERR